MSNEYNKFFKNDFNSDKTVTNQSKLKPDDVRKMEAQKELYVFRNYFKTVNSSHSTMSDLYISKNDSNSKLKAIKSEFDELELDKFKSSFINSYEYKVMQILLGLPEHSSISGKSKAYYLEVSLEDPLLTVPASIKEAYNEKVIFILQQYKQLNPTYSGFSVTLCLDKREETIYIPYSAILSFKDHNIYIKRPNISNSSGRWTNK